MKITKIQISIFFSFKELENEKVQVIPAFDHNIIINLIDN